MFRLIRGLLSLALLVALVYVAVRVPLGQRTFWQHLCAIARGPETRALLDGVKQRVQSLWGTGAGTGAPGTPPLPQPTPASAADALTADERARLRRLIRRQIDAHEAKRSPGAGGAQPSSNSLQNTTSPRGAVVGP